MFEKPLFSIGKLGIICAALFLFFTSKPAVGAGNAGNCVPPVTGLQAWWAGDDGTDSFETNHGVFKNGAFAAGGKVGNALTFDGVNDFFEVPDGPSWPSGTKPFTIEFWTRINTNKSSTLDTPGAIFAAQDEGPGWRNKWFFAHGGGKLFFHVATANHDWLFLAQAPFSPTVGRWYHLAVARSENVFQIYVDGVLAGAELNTVSLPDIAAPLTIGQSEQLGFLNGQMDEVSIYSRALLQTEILAIVAADSSGKCFSPRPPEILTDAHDLSLPVGDYAAFSVVATGSAPLSYQWFFNEAPLPQETNSVLEFRNIGINQDGRYRVVVTNAHGMAAGTNATLTVLPAPNCSSVPGVTGWWKGENGAADSHALNNGVLQNGAAIAPGKVGSGFRFDGIDDFAEIPDSDAWPSGTRPFTIDFWVNFNSVKSSPMETPGVIFAAQDEGPGWRNKWFFAYGGGKLFLHVVVQNRVVLFLAQAPFSPVLGSWYHLALVRSDTLFQIYVDGVLAGSEVNAISFPDVAAPLTFGQSENLGFLNGMMDEITFFDRPLSQSEIQAIRTAGVTGKCPPRQFTLSTTVSAGSGSITVSPQLASYPEGISVLVTAIPDPGSKFDGWEGDLSGLTNPVSLQMNSGKNISARFVTNSAGGGCLTPPQSMVGWWRAEASAQDAVLTNHGVLRGSPAYDGGIVGAAFSFNGTNGYMEAPDSDLWAFGANDFSIEFWVNFRSLAPSSDVSQPSAVFIGNDEGPGVRNKWFFSLGGGKLCFLAFSPGTGGKFLVQAPFVPLLGQWYHLAVVRSGSLFTIYRDGIATGSESAAVVVPNPAAPLTFGQAEGLFYLNGLMDEVSIYRRALTGPEIQAIWINRSTGKCGAPISPTVVVQPRDKTANEGVAVSLEIGASGSAPLQYQWFQGTNELAGATNAVFSIPSSRLSDSGQYSVTVSNDAGSAKSSSASLTIQLAPPCVPPVPNMVAWWRADGDTQDSISTLHGTLKGGAAISSGKVRSAFSFNSKSSFVEVPDSDLWSFGPNDFSIEFWVNFRTLNSSSGVGEPAAVFVANDEGPSTVNKWIFSLGGGKLCLIAYSQAIGSRFLAQAPFAPVLGQWYHLALVRDGNTFTIYSNGVVVGSETAALSLPNPNAPLTIGHAEGLFFLNGMIDELAIYRRALRFPEIQAIYQADTTGRCDPQFFKLATFLSGNGTISPPPGTNAYLTGTTVSLLATPLPGNRFAGWSGDLTGFANPGLILLDSNKVITATFASNAPPMIQLTNPVNGEIFSAPAKISLGATAVDSDGSISKVEFYRGTTLLRTFTTSPYVFALTNIGPGQYTYAVKATDNDGGVTTSLPVNINVGPTNALLLTVASRSSGSGAELVVPVTVRGFSFVRSLQFSIHWDPALLSFVTVEQFGLPALTGDNFGTGGAPTGTLRLSWDDPSGPGQSRPEDSILFGLRFGLVGTNGTSSAVLIDGSPIIVEAVNGSGATVPVLARAGEVQIRPQPIIHVSGTVSYFDLAKNVSGVTLLATGDAQQNVQSGTNGGYEITLTPGSYTITPRKSDDAQPGLGVSTADISLIRRQILGIATTLESPYKLLAADVNNSGTVTTADIGLIRRLILDNAIPAPLGLWRFLRADQTFNDPQNPWGAEGSRSYTDVSFDLDSQNFIAIKLGDVNASWTPSVPAGALSSPVRVLSSAVENARTVTFKVSSQQASLGSASRLKVSARGFNGVASTQFTLHWDPLLWSLSGTGDYGLPGLSDDNLGTVRANQGILTFSWDDPAGTQVSLPDGADLFSVTLFSRGKSPSQSIVSFADEPVAHEVTAPGSGLLFSGEDGKLEAVSPPQIVPGSIKLNGSHLEFSLTGQSGESYLLQSSIDLVRWTTVTTLFNETGTVAATASISGSMRFYRIVAP